MYNDSSGSEHSYHFITNDNIIKLTKPKYLFNNKNIMLLLFIIC